MRRLLPLVVLVLVIGYQAGGGKPTPAATATPAAATTPSATAAPRSVLIDTDLSHDDLIAIAMVLVARDVDVRATTVAGTGLVHCYPGLDHLRDLLTRLAKPNVPVACGRPAGPGAGGGVPRGVAVGRGRRPRRHTATGRER